jgi:hypothetical protein
MESNVTEIYPNLLVYNLQGQLRKIFGLRIFYGSTLYRGRFFLGQNDLNFCLVFAKLFKFFYDPAL